MIDPSPPYLCDGCKKSRGDDSNHWFLANVVEGSLVLRSWDSSSPEMIQKATYHLCGSVCLHKIVQKFIDERRISTNAVS